MGRISFGGWVVVLGVVCLLVWECVVLVTYETLPDPRTGEGADSESADAPPMKSFAGGGPEVMVVAVHDPVEVEALRDRNTRVYTIARDIEEEDPDTGEVRRETVESRVVEKGANLCYRDGADNWAPTDASFESAVGGFRMDRNNFRVELGGTLDDAIEYTVAGKTVTLKLGHFLVNDGTSTADVGSLNAEVEVALDESAPSKLRFANPFGGNIADVEYVVERGGFHQNVVLNAPVTAPQGFDAAGTRLYIYTEVSLDDFTTNGHGTVSVAGESIDAGAQDLLVDAGTSRPVEFRATIDGRDELLHWFAESEITGANGKTTLARRQLYRDPATGKTYLVESVALSDLEGLSYPVTWDYETKSGTISGDETWTANNEYRVTGDVTITGSVTIEPGTEVKIYSGCSIIASSGGKLVA